LRTKILVHFSGGSDSTLTAALMAEKYEQVYLITYNRFSFRGAKDTYFNYKKLTEVYGEKKFIKIDEYPIQAWYKKLSYAKYFKTLKKFKTVAVLPCGPCKLSMHWHSLVFSLNEGIQVVADGSVPYMDIYPDQNKRIVVDNLRALYKDFDIEYLTPVYNIGEDVEKLLYDKGINNGPQVRGTINDKQIYCAEQVNFALFTKYFLSRHTKLEYEEQLHALYKEKMLYMKDTLKEYLAESENSFLYKMLTDEEKHRTLELRNE